MPKIEPETMANHRTAQKPSSSAMGERCYLHGLLRRELRRPFRLALSRSLDAPVPPSLRRSLNTWMTFHLMATLATLGGLMQLGLPAVWALIGMLVAAAWAGLLWSLFRIHLSLARAPSGSVRHNLGLPNGLTTLRLVFAPALFLLLAGLTHLHRAALPTLLCLWALGLTDSLDGLLARTTGSVTVFGRDLDPAADIVTSSSATGGLLALGAIPWWLASLVFLRYLGALLGLVLLMAMGRTVTVRSTRLGKVATPALQIYLFLAAYGHLARLGLAPEAWALSQQALTILAGILAGILITGIFDLAWLALRSRKLDPLA